VISASVVIGVFNGAELLGEQLEALARQRPERMSEVVIADNGSTDGTIAVAKSYADRFAHFVVVDASDASGVSHARNVGAARARGDCVLFCDHDDVVGQGWLEAMTDALELHPFVAARLDHRLLNPPWTIGYFGEPQRHTLPGVDWFLPYAWGGSLGIRRDLHLAVGGFDESFREGGEDNDYCWRIHLAGTPLMLVDGALVHYRHRRSLAAIFRQSRGYGRGAARLWSKYGGRSWARPSQVEALCAWALLLPRLPRAMRTQEARARWVSALGWRVGRLQGSIRWRVLAL